MSDPRRSTGASGEQAAAEFLGERGWRIVARNARIARGEIDLIGLDGPSLVFVEVKSRRAGGGAAGPANAGIALESIGPRKQLQVRRLARAWLAEHRPPGHYSQIRFDAIGVSVSPNGTPTAIEHILNAF